MSAVVLVVTKEKDIPAMVTWGTHIAEALELSLCVVHPMLYPKPQAPLPQALDTACSQPVLEALRQHLHKQTDGPERSLYLVQGPDPLEQVLRLVEKKEAALLVTGPDEIHNDKNTVLRRKRDGLLARASCDVLVLRDTAESHKQPARILVPVAGGPHSSAALRLALALDAPDDVEVTALYVEPEAGEEAREVGQRILERVLRPFRPEQRKNIKTRVVLADHVIDGIVQAIEEKEPTLVLLGATTTGWLDKSLFGNIPVKLMQRQVPVALGVLHSSQPVAHKARHFLRYLFNLVLPQLKRDERVDLFERLQSGSHVSIDFITLIGLATVIASFGLINNAAAVIIGAMLVAPLMTPMIGAGLGLVQGNVILVREAMRAIALGFVLSLVLGLLCGLLGRLKFPGVPLLTAELLARCQFNAFDLFVAWFSGLAAAYALARPGLLAALPGVAIAAALVPPIATVGVALSWGYPSHALQAASLFGINFLAITLASTQTLFSLGIRAQKKQAQLWARRATIGLMLVALIVAAPLLAVLVVQVTPTDLSLKQALRKTLKSQPGLALARLEHPRAAKKESILLTLYCTTPPAASQRRDLTTLVRKHLRNPNLPVRVTCLQSWNMPAPPPRQR